MPSFCVVSNCELKYSHSENISFHKFPFNNPKILSHWIRFTGRGSNWKPSRWSSICSRHFDITDFREYLSRKCLKKNAVPTVNAATKNNISYETYLLNNTSDYARTESYDFGTCSESHINSEKSALCRLCGERIDYSISSEIGLVEDDEINAMIIKCLPNINMNPDVDPSRSVCVECVTQLKQYSDFVDRILIYQKDFVWNESYSVDPQNHHTIAETSNTNNLGPIFIKQEPINVKQEKIDNSIRKSQGSQSAYNSLDTAEDLDISHIKFSSTHCERCNRIFLSHFELSNHECLDEVSSSEKEPTNNCEIMEIITLNKPVSFIDLAEDELNIVEIKKLKTENILEIDRHVEVEHAYAKKTVHLLKEEIIDIGNSEQGLSNVYTLDPSSDNCENNSIETTVIDTSLSTYKCNQCQKTFTSQEFLDDHLTNMHSFKTKTCPICTLQFNSIYEYLRHKTKSHRTTCLRCKKKFSSNWILRNHEKMCKREINDFIFSCKHCNTQINSFMEMRRHVKLCNRKAKIVKKSNNLSNQRTANIRECLNPYVTESGKYTCTFCYRIFTRLKNFNEHQEMHIKYNHERDTSLTFDDPANLKNDEHIITLGPHTSNTYNRQNIMIANDANVDIKYAGNLMKTTALKMQNKLVFDSSNEQYLITKHIKEQRELPDTEKKFNCSLCPKRFRGRSGLVQHINGFHYKIKPYSCPVCCYSYALKGDMQRCRHSKNGLLK